jgi:hypothetical protein
MKAAVIILFAAVDLLMGCPFREAKSFSQFGRGVLIQLAVSRNRCICLNMATPTQGMGSTSFTRKVLTMSIEFFITNVPERFKVVF